MPESPHSKAVKRATLANENIKLVTSNPELTDKIKLDIEPGAEKIFWYIRFNIALDPETVNRKTMKVMEPNGYILETELSYRQETNYIVLSPLDSFAQDEFYVLKISKKVHSAKGQALPKEINILFKLLGGQISDFQILKSTVKLPKPKPRPKNYVPKGAESPAKIYSHGGDRFEGKQADMLPYAPMRINVLIGVIGLLLSVVSFAAIDNLTVRIVCLGICLIGVGHIIVQLFRKKLRSELLYNRGAHAFNRARYKNAAKYLKKAAMTDPENEMAEYGASKVKYYL